MTIYLLVREDQNQHGFVDTGVIGAFRSKKYRGLRCTEVQVEQGNRNACGRWGGFAAWWLGRRAEG